MSKETKQLLAEKKVRHWVDLYYRNEIEFLTFLKHMAREMTEFVEDMKEYNT